jgi:hypothetical protein
MVVLWWITGILLILLSFVLWLSGLAGREGVLQIGRATVSESRQDRKTEVRPARLLNVAVGVIGILVGLTIVLMVAF